jgi:hypothetical protein
LVVGLGAAVWAAFGGVFSAPFFIESLLGASAAGVLPQAKKPANNATAAAVEIFIAIMPPPSRGMVLEPPPLID